MDITISQTAQHIQDKAIWMHQNVFKTCLNGAEKVKTMFLILMLLSASTHDEFIKTLDHSSTCELSLALLSHYTLYNLITYKTSLWHHTSLAHNMNLNLVFRVNEKKKESE